MNQRYILLPLVLLLFVGLVRTGPAFAQTTAQDGFADVLAAAQNEASDATFIGLIGNDISHLDGTASSWFYVMQSTSSENVFGYAQIEGQISSTISLTEFPNEFMEFLTPGAVSPVWMDSDGAIDVAEENGGAAFRAQYPEARISAALIGIPSSEVAELELPPLPSLWVISYTSATSESIASRVHVVDALFGIHFELETTTAQDNLDAANETAADFASDAQLVSVSTLLPDFDSAGEASIWVYTYYSPSLEDGTMVIAASGLPLTATPLLMDPVSTQPLPEDWFDSPIAAENAVIEEGPVRDIVQSPSLVQARVATGLSEEFPNTAYWQVNYLLLEDNFLENLIETQDLDGISLESTLVLAEEEPVDPVVQSAFTLIDADTDTPIDGFNPIAQDAILDLAFLPENLNITVSFNVSVESVDFELNGDLVNTEGNAPYALFGDNAGDFNPGQLPVQEHILKAIPTVGGQPGEAQSVSFEVINSLVPSITDILIVDAETDFELFEFNDNAAYRIDQLPAQVNLVARTNDRAKSVLFDLNSGFYSRLENVPPFAFFGDVSGDFLPGSLPVGGHVLSVTPYSEVMKAGEQGPTRTIRFTILEASPTKTGIEPGFYVEPINGLSADLPTSFALNNNYPNPFNPETTISFEVPTTSRIQVIVYDMLGRQVEVLADATFEPGQHAIRFSASNLSSGLYLYRLVTPTGTYSNKMMLLK